MAERTEANDFLSVFARPTLAPAASPVDTYVRPTLAPSRGEQLGAALSSLDSLRPGLQREAQREADRELAEGEALFEQHRGDFAEAVRSGQIPAGASPYIRRGYRISQLRTLSSSYTVELNRAMESSNIHEIDDPAQVEAFIREFTTDFETANGVSSLPAREVDRHYRPYTQQAQNAFRQEQAQRNIALMEERRVRAFEQELFAALETNPGADISGWINAAAAEMYAEGIDHSVIERTIMGAVGTFAMERGSVAAANMLARVEVAEMGPLGGTAQGREMIENIRDRVAAQAQAQAAASAAADRRQRAAEQASIEQQIATAYLAGDTETASSLAATLVEYDPDAAYTWANRADTAGDELGTELHTDNAAVLVSAAIESGDREFALEIARTSLANGDIGMAEYNQIRSVIGDVYPDPVAEDEPDPPPSILQSLHDDHNFDEVTGWLDGLVTGEDVYGTAPNEARNAGQQARRGLQNDAVAWMEQNRDPTTGTYDELAFQDFLWSRADHWRDRYLPDGAFSTADSINDPTGTTGPIQDPSAPNDAVPPSQRGN